MGRDTGAEPSPQDPLAGTRAQATDITSKSGNYGFMGKMAGGLAQGWLNKNPLQAPKPVAPLAPAPVASAGPTAMPVAQNPFLALSRLK